MKTNSQTAENFADQLHRPMLRLLPAFLGLSSLLRFLAPTSDAIDPDIDRLLKTAPRPGDFNGAVVYPPDLSPLFVRPKVPEPDDATRTARFELDSKLIHIRFPHLRFQTMPARKAFQWIAEQSALLDPKHHGVPIHFDFDTAPGSAGARALDRPITLSHDDVPLDEAIRYVTAALDLRFAAENGGIRVFLWK